MQTNTTKHSLLRGLVRATSGLVVLTLFLAPGDMLFWFLSFHLTSFIASGLLAIALKRHWLGWSLAAFWIPVLPALWLSFRPENNSVNMTASDNCWYNMERDVNHMMVVGLMFFDAAPAPEKLEQLLRERLLCFSRFRQIPKMEKGVRQWVDDEHFALARHVEYCPLETSSSQAFAERVNTLSGKKLDFDQPLWHMQIIPNHPSGAALVLRIHHCIADGIALVRVLLSMTEQAQPNTSEAQIVSNTGETVAPDTRAQGMEPANGSATAHRNAAPSEKAVSSSRNNKQSPITLLKELLQAFPRMIMLPDSKTSFKHPLTGVRRTAWTTPMPLNAIKRIASAHNAKINDVVLAATAGALRRYFQAHNEPTTGITLRVLVPINLRPLTGPIELGNKVGFIYLPLPVGCADPVARLRDVKAGMDAIKSGKEAFLSYLSLCFLGTLPQALQHVLIDTFNQNASSTMTNVPGPKEALSFAGQRVTHMNFFGPQSGKMGVGISVFSYQNELTLGITTDAGMVPHPEQFTACFEQEIAEWPAT